MKKGNNAWDDFFMTVLTSHIIAASLKHLQMHSMSECLPEYTLPCAEDLWAYPKVERKILLSKLSLSMIHEFINFDLNSQTSSEKVTE